MFICKVYTLNGNHSEEVWRQHIFSKNTFSVADWSRSKWSFVNFLSWGVTICSKYMNHTKPGSIALKNNSKCSSSRTSSKDVSSSSIYSTKPQAGKSTKPHACSTDHISSWWPTRKDRSFSSTYTCTIEADTASGYLNSYNG